jgi:hypothetical protein
VLLWATQYSASKHFCILAVILIPLNMAIKF